MFTCYLLKCKLFGDTYIGVTGQTIDRRKMQHYRSDKFPDGFSLTVLGTSESRHEINKLEAQAIAEYRPTLNQRKGGNSVGGYYSRRKAATHCRRGHEFTSENTQINGSKRRCLICYKNNDRKSYQAAYYETVTKKKRKRKS